MRLWLCGIEQDKSLAGRLSEGRGWLRMYNIFRLTGDGLHCLALIVLFAKMNQTRSCAGEHRIEMQGASARCPHACP